MQKITFENLPSTTTPVNATNLNLLQNNVEDALALKEEAIVYGSTANGKYIKYDNGTLIQWGTVDKSSFLNSTDAYNTVQGINFYRSAGYTLYTPLAFIDTNYTVFVQPLQGFTTGASRLETTRIQKVTDGSFDIQIVGVESFTSTGNGYINLLGVDWLAIGRWK